METVEIPERRVRLPINILRVDLPKPSYHLTFWQSTILAWQQNVLCPGARESCSESPMSGREGTWKAPKIRNNPGIHTTTTGVTPQAPWRSRSDVAKMVLKVARTELNLPMLLAMMRQMTGRLRRTGSWVTSVSVDHPIFPQAFRFRLNPSRLLMHDAVQRMEEGKAKCIMAAQLSNELRNRRGTVGPAIRRAH